MEPKQIFDVLPSADPAFVRILAALPIRAEFMQPLLAALPHLHALFLAKREAFLSGAWDAFHAVLEKEERVLTSLIPSAS
jgi:hypothetical protein